MTATVTVLHRAPVKFLKTRNRWEACCTGCEFFAIGEKHDEAIVRDAAERHERRRR